MSLTEQIQADANAAAKAQERGRLAALRLLVDALTKEAKEKRTALDEQGEIAVLKRERKRRLEAAEAYRQAGREESAASEQTEATIIDSYLPAELADDELTRLVEEAIAESGASSPQELGKVMPIAMRKAAGRADGKRVNQVVREKLESLRPPVGGRSDMRGVRGR
jgi:uncharacterized protein YqeY